jgi:hypothetical protein
MVMYKEPLKNKWTQLECNNDIRDWGLKEQLCLGCKGDFSKFRKQTVVLEVRHCGGAGHCPSKRTDYPQLGCWPLSEVLLVPLEKKKMAVSL